MSGPFANYYFVNYMIQVAAEDIDQVYSKVIFEHPNQTFLYVYLAKVQFL